MCSDLLLDSLFQPAAGKGSKGSILQSTVTYRPRAWGHGAGGVGDAEASRASHSLDLLTVRDGCAKPVRSTSDVIVVTRAFSTTLSASHVSPSKSKRHREQNESLIDGNCAESIHYTFVMVISLPSVKAASPSPTTEQPLYKQRVKQISSPLSLSAAEPREEAAGHSAGTTSLPCLPSSGCPARTPSKQLPRDRLFSGVSIRQGD